MFGIAGQQLFCVFRAVGALKRSESKTFIALRKSRIFGYIFKLGWKVENCVCDSGSLVYTNAVREMYALLILQSFFLLK